MAKYLKSKQPARKSVKPNNPPAKVPTSLRKVRRNIYRQAALAGLTIVLTVVILFAMTSAWYTNIVQSSGLTFQAEAWGFNGTIKVDTESIKAAPGDDGIVNLEVANNSDTISAISINVNKSEMLEEMQKRLFFYVDTRMSRNNETMERVYLNRVEGYTYNVFNKGTLTLTEQISNGPVIKWEWVYDVLGYYVLAQPYTVEKTVTDADGKAVTNEEGETLTETITGMTIREYLRPIEYDYDEATTVINRETDEDGNVVSVSVVLDTVDGTVSPEDYLIRLSRVDGYKGEISPDKMVGNYYMVDVDAETGYGVYAYLCNYSEIQQATQYDTELGEIAYKYANNIKLTTAEEVKLYHKATLVLSAQKNESTTINATTLSVLQSAITNGYADVVQLSSDITIPDGSVLTIPKNTQVMLDLNGHTITNTSGTAIDALTGSSLTLINGSVVQGAAETDGVRSIGINTAGAEVVMSKVSIEGFQYGLYVGDNAADNDMDSRVHLVGCTIVADNYAAFVSGNGSLSDQKTQLILEDCTLESKSIVISGNGDTSGNGRWGTDIQIIKSRIYGKKNDSDVYAGGIYQPQKDSTLTVYQSYVEGYNGITVKGGTAKIIDSTVKGLGPAIAADKLAFGSSGYCDTGDAVYIETNYGYDIELYISGGSILTTEDADAQSLRVYESTATNVLVQIESGIFDEKQPDDYIAENSAQTAKQDTSGAIVSYVVTAPDA